MNKLFLRIILIVIFVIAALGITSMIFFPLPWNSKKSRTEQQARMVIPRSPRAIYEDIDNLAEHLAREDSMFSRVELEDGEVLVSVLTDYFDGGPVEKQFVAYRNLLEIDSPIYLTFIDYDLETRSFKRLWNARTAATRPGTINLYAQDLLGDRSLCILLYGMNGQGQHTLTIFRKNPLPSNDPSELFLKIAELRIDGNITVREIDRNISYQSGQEANMSSIISAFGRDSESRNLLDQVEITYAFNYESGLYEEINMARIPGTQVEQRRVRELLSNTRVFEEFITGLWFHITPQGNLNSAQYIYFSPDSKEIIFYEDEIQQVFTWTNSNPTRVGLYISSQNISVTTLRRSIDIELESLDSIRVRVIEDVRLKFGVNTPWDGSYRKAGHMDNPVHLPSYTNSHISALYEGQIGKFRFDDDGSFEMTAGNSQRQGKYAFFFYNDLEMIEFRYPDLRYGDLRPPETFYADLNSDNSLLRETYLVESDSEDFPRTNLTFYRVRIGSRGIERLHERAITLNLAE